MNITVLFYGFLAVMCLCGCMLLFSYIVYCKEMRHIERMKAKFAVEDALMPSPSRTIEEVITMAEEKGYRAEPDLIRVQYEMYLGEKGQREEAERIEKAMNLLLNPHYTIEEIAEELKFASAEVLVKKITEHKGMTPEAFRAKVAEARKPDESSSSSTTV